jgi:hypothetical protein
MKLIFGMVPYFDPTRRNVKREKYGSPDPPPPLVMYFLVSQNIIVKYLQINGPVHMQPKNVSTRIFYCHSPTQL